MSLGPIKVTRVTRDVYCVQRVKMLSCSYFVIQSDGVVLIDAGMDVDAADMTAGLQEVSCSLQDVKALLITHWHNDHSTGAAAVREASQARVMCHADSVRRLAREEKAGGLRGIVSARLPMRGFLGSVRGLLELAPPRAVAANQLLADGDRVLDDFEVLETPGHVAGHLSFFYRPEGVLFTGDALAVAHDKLSFMSRFLTDDKAAARESMMRCIRLQADAYCPGHRAPLVNPSTADLQKMQSRLEQLRWWPIIGCGE